MLALPLAACTGQASPATSTASGSDPALQTAFASAPVAGHDPAVASETMASPLVLPFAPYFAIARQAEQKSQESLYAGLSQQYAAAEQEVAACAQEHGFVYYPTGLSLPASGIPTGDTLPIPALPAERAEVERYGYGVTAGTLADGPVEPDDPNAAYLDSLSPAAQQAYDDAMSGLDGCTAPLGSLQEPATTDNGWYEDAATAMAMALNGAKGGSADNLQAGLPAGPELAALDDEYLACLTRTGVATAADLTAIYPRTGPALAYQLAVRTGADGRHAALDADTANLPDGQDSLTGSALEKAIALADYDCRLQTDYVGRYALLLAQAEDAWAAANHQVLDTLVAAWEQAK